VSPLQQTDEYVTVVARSVGKNREHSVTFEVSDDLLMSAEWSEPVQFRFERWGEAGDFQLVMRTCPERA
jgi:hypothetical protein